MSHPRKNRRAFHPTLNGALLEDRVVPSTLTSAEIQAALQSSRGISARAFFATLPVAAPSGIATSSSSAMTVRQVENAYLRQVRTATTDLRQTINSELTQLFASGKPTAQQLAAFDSFAQGAVDATALRLSSQAALLPGSSTHLVSAIQDSLLSTSAGSLVSRIQNAVNSSRATQTAQALQSAVTRQVTSSMQTQSARLGNFFNTTSLNRLSVDTSGSRIPLQQFIGNQIVSQLGDSLGALAQSFPTVANSVLFANGVTTPTTTAQTAFMNQTAQALGTVAFQLGSDLALTGQNETSLIPQLQSSFFAPGSATNSLVNALQTLPFGTTGFNTAATTAFNTAFQNIVSPLNGFLNLPLPTSTLTLPDGEVVGIFNQSLSSFGGGFNNGFGSGFVGFGQPGIHSRTASAAVSSASSAT